ncbi:adenylate/guanylate cyclase domain-containing protein [Treponema parvum]|uniref:Adenylate/guanylate cyclase domain-containing protein n=1 Tax=Treponema parvum TaxID=138851 RepID=A0A975IDY1_9SPIR|nr:adenylate/guanylate cyclase domain-containing protein [Treponema parvum]QTQ13381.1 adenylate/guanylate cyclase domain-containing protein [Treponema parvum]
MKKLKKRNVAVFVGVFALCSLLHFSGFFTFAENKAYDARTVLTPERTPPSDEICFIAVDQASIDWAQKEKGWGWPWPRSAYGDIVRYMTLGDAACVLLDVLYTEPSVYGIADDENFAIACRENGRVVQVMFADTASGGGSASAESEKGYKALFPVESLKNSAALLANIISAKDGDDVIRRTRLSFNLNGIEYPSLGAAPFVIGEQRAGKKSVAEAISSLKKNSPLLPDETVLLRYKRNIDSYLPYRACDILKSYDALLAGKEPILPPENFKNTAVFLAYYAPGLFDICSSPVSQVYPGVGVHITAYDNILNGGFVKKLPAWLNLIYLFAVCFAGAMVLDITGRQKNQKTAPVIAAAALFLGVAAIISLSFVLFYFNLWILLAAPLTGFILSFGTQVFLGYVFEGRQKKFIKSAFSQYLSPAVIEQLITDPKKLKLGGEKREISIYFSDIQGFTSVSEKLSPEALTEFLNTYLSAMTDIILNTGGTIDKYEGDAIIAFWNAPADEEDHALRAVDAAMQCQRQLSLMRAELAKLSGGQIYQRIGLNTGYAVVGNMGSHSRFDYTMLGDSVNLASRLEGLNKQFGTYTMCSKATKDAAVKFGCNLYWRELARVAVVGKKEAVTVFEPLEMSEFEKKFEIFENFDKARDLFYSGRFSDSILLFERFCGEDGPCRSYAQKCRILMENPNDQWDGVWHSTEK